MNCGLYTDTVTKPQELLVRGTIMTFETIIGLSFLAFAVIAYAFSRLTVKRAKYVNQKAKNGGETDYVVVLYI